MQPSTLVQQTIDAYVDWMLNLYNCMETHPTSLPSDLILLGNRCYELRDRLSESECEVFTELTLGHDNMDGRLCPLHSRIRGGV